MYTEKLTRLSDDELLQRLNSGSKLAFETLYDRYWKQVYNAAYKRLNNAEYAQDIAQDVFVQLWLRGTNSPIANLRAYLHVSARNGVFKHIEKQSKFADLPEAPVHLESPLSNADAQLLFHEFRTSFYRLISTLPAQQLIIFNMRFEQELTSQQIADALHLSPKTVRNQIGRALGTIKNAMMIAKHEATAGSLMAYEH